MTILKAETIELLKKYKEESEEDCYVKRAKALDEAIKVLSAEPCDVAISRQSVLEILGGVLEYWEEHVIDIEPHEFESTFLEQLSYNVEQVGNLPFVKPTRTKGRWFDKGSLSCRCSACGCKSPEEYKFCPHCGAQMESEE